MRFSDPDDSDTDSEYLLPEQTASKGMLYIYCIVYHCLFKPLLIHTKSF